MEEAEEDHKVGREEGREVEEENPPDCWRLNPSEEAAVETVLRCRLNGKFTVMKISTF